MEQLELLCDVLGWSVCTVELPDGIFGVTDWSSRTIIIDPRLTTAQARSTLAHELAHVVGGPGERERTVEERAARHLVDFDALIDALRWTRQPAELADVLWIDTDMLQTLTDSLDDGERQILDEAIDELDIP